MYESVSSRSAAVPFPGTEAGTAAIEALSQRAGTFALAAQNGHPAASHIDLQRQGAYFRALAEQSLDIISVLDATGAIVFASPALERWTGWSPDELMGRNAFQLMHPADVSRIVERFSEGLLAPGNTEMAQYRFRHKDGTWRVLESWGKNLISNPLVRGVIITSRDVTDRRRTELRQAALKDLASRLNSLETLAAMASALASATDEVFAWDSFSFCLLSRNTGRLDWLLSFDIVDGSRSEISMEPGHLEDGSLAARALREGAFLINRDGGLPHRAGAEGDSAPAGSLMFAPVQGAAGPGAVIAVQSRAPGAYSQEHLEVLKEIAGQCSALLDRIQSRAELLEKEKRYRTLVEELPVAVLIHQNKRIVYANPAAARLLGAPGPEHLTGTSVFELIPPNMREFIAERIERAQRGENSHWLEQRITRLDKTFADVEASSLGTTHEGQPAVQTILHEITGRKRAEQRQSVQYAATRALAQSSYDDTPQKLLQLICDGLGWKAAEFWTIDGVSRSLKLTTAVHPNEARYVAFTESGQRHASRLGEGLPGTIWAEQKALWIEDLQRERAFLRRELAAAAGFISAAAYPVYMREEFAGVIQLYTDDRRPFDADLLELLKVLSTQLGQFLERRQMQQQLLQAQKMEAVGQLAGGVAHDFNNILTIITGHAQLALLMPDASDEVRSELNEISSAVTRAANLTRQLLTFSRKQVMQKKSLHLDMVINDLAKMLRRLIGEDVTLTLKHALDLPPVEGDVGMIEQVLLNLAVNARDAMPDGGDLLIETRRFTVDQAHLRRAPQGRAGDFARIEVRDNGCGMPPEVLGRLFEPFFTTKPVGRGTGLGLATVYGIVKQHGGWIEVNSQVNTGTAFQVYLPITSAAPTGQSATPPPSARGHNQVILLVEDETSLRVLAQKLLEKAGYKVMAASSGAEALEKWRHKGSQIDLVVTDMVMPGGVSGKQLADRIWATDPSARVVFTSGYTSELSDETLAREKLRFLAKPYSPAEMLRVIAEALEQPRVPKGS